MTVQEKERKSSKFHNKIRRPGDFKCWANEMLKRLKPVIITLNGEKNAVDPTPSDDDNIKINVLISEPSLVIDDNKKEAQLLVCAVKMYGNEEQKKMAKKFAENADLIWPQD